PAAFGCVPCNGPREARHEELEWMGPRPQGAARRVEGARVHTPVEGMILRRREMHRFVHARWRCWAEELDPWSPRPVDYVVAAVLFLLLALVYVGERTDAVQLNRRLFRLEERRAGLQSEVDVLAADATALADRQRIVSMAGEQLGMTVPDPDAIEHVYYVRSRQSGTRVAPGDTGSSGVDIVSP
ncbi:MAG: hypothetical protein ACE5G2_04775, partial [Candidatus Krumholzibacteriia bacterium]